MDFIHSYLSSCYVSKTDVLDCGHRELDGTALYCTCVIALSPDGIYIFQGREHPLIMIIAIMYQFSTMGQELC